jgi:thiosulfate dehydrogenase
MSRRRATTGAAIAAVFVVMIGVALLVSTRRDEEGPSATAGDARTAPSDPAVGDPVRGLALLNHFRDSLPSHSGNALRCTSCHLDNGTRPDAMPWLGTTTRYPRYRERPGMEESLQRRINECIARSLAGRMLHEDSREMRDVMAYLGTLGDRPRPADARVIKTVGVVARGEGEYGRQCARCHGATGDGTPLAPAVWGPESYSVGAGLARQFSLATFLRHNMPHDKPASLTDEQAADIAAYVLSQARQDHPGKERDWPNGDAPVDVAYGTTAARAKGRPDPAPRPLLPRRVTPDSLSTPSTR